jgi:YjbE family integral membrane protein
LVFDLDVVSKILKIILYDLVLSGDNAVVIGMAARRLSPVNRRRAVIIGGAGAVGLRILFTGMAAVILDPERGIPVIGLVGGALLIWISYRLIRPQDHGAHVTEADSLAQAIRTIIVADVVMSLDNILAVGAEAEGHLWLLLFGLGLSIPILLVGSGLVARMLGRYPILVYIGAIILVHTAVEMMLEDELVHRVYEVRTLVIWLAAAIVAALIVLIGRRAGAPPVAETAEPEHLVVTRRPEAESGP